MKPLLAVLHVTEELFIAEMKERFGRKDGTIILCKFLDENGIKYKFSEFYNMFVLWEHLAICHSRLNTFATVFHDAMMNTYGINLSRKI